MTYKVLDINKVLKARIGIFSHHLTDRTNDFFKSYPSYHVLFFVTCGFITSSTLFVCTHLTEFGLALQTACIVIAGYQCLGMFLGVGLKLHKVKEFHRTIQNIVDEGILNFPQTKLHFNQFPKITPHSLIRQWKRGVRNVLAE